MALVRATKRLLMTSINMRDNYLTTGRIEDIIEEIRQEISITVCGI